MDITVIQFFGSVLLMFWAFVPAVFILRKLDKAANERKSSGKLMIGDFFSLIYLLQFPMAFYSNWATYRRETGEIRTGYGLAAVGALVMLAIWWKTIQTVCQAGITETSHRWGIAIIVIPTTFTGSYLMPWLFVIGISEPERWPWAIYILITVSFIASMRIVNRALAHDSNQTQASS